MGPGPADQPARAFSFPAPASPALRLAFPECLWVDTKSNQTPSLEFATIRAPRRASLRGSHRTGDLLT